MEVTEEGMRRSLWKWKAVEPEKASLEESTQFLTLVHKTQTV